MDRRVCPRSKPMEGAGHAFAGNSESNWRKLPKRQLVDVLHLPVDAERVLECEHI